MKEAKGNPWSTLEKSSKTAAAPVSQACWNNRRTRKAGDTLIGTVGEIVDTVTAFGPGKVLHVVSREGKKEGLFLSQVLKNQIQNVGGFAKGDKVFVKYLGVPAGKRYALYTCGKA